MSSPQSPIGKFKSAPIRWLARDTMGYLQTFLNMTHPTVLGDALHCDLMLGGSLEQKSFSTPHLRKLIKSEINDFWNGDIPFFWSYTDSPNLYSSEGTVFQNYFKTTGLKSLEKRLETIEQHKYPQLNALSMSLRSLTSPPPHELKRNYAIYSYKKVSTDELIYLSNDIAKTLLKTSYNIDGFPFWVGLTPLKDRSFSATLLQPSLYEGFPGIGVFFAYLYKISGNDLYKHTALNALTFIEHCLAANSADSPSGAFCGTGGLLYAHALISSALPYRGNNSINFNSMFKNLEQQIKNDSHFDIISGSSGLLLVALRLFKQTKNEAAKRIVLSASKHLIQHAETKGPFSTWNTLPEHNFSKRLGGMAHGVSGIAWALSESISLVTYSNKIVPFIERALAYEESLFDAYSGAWIDARSNTTTSFWCHGSTGIGLAAKKMEPILGHELSKNIIERAQESTWLYGKSLSHSLCHGNLGNAELFLLTGQKDRADSITHYVLDRHKKTGEWTNDLPGNYSTQSLMCGLAGIGYGLLRNAYPDIVPSILTLEMPDKEKRDHDARPLLSTRKSINSAS